MPDINIGHTVHRVGNRICTDKPQDPCENKVHINPMTGLPFALSTRVDLVQTTGGAFSVGTRKVNYRTNRHPKKRRLIPGFNN